MFDIENYVARLTEQLKEKFGDRLVYVGLQGSWLRGEATDDSDIDIMAVIDGMSVADMAAYRGIIEGMERYDHSCGFICSKEDLANWNPMEIWHVVNGTRDYYGTLLELAPEYSEQDIRNFVKMSVNNMYHEICHRFIHADAQHNREALPFTYKGVFFILQNLHYLKTGAAAATKAELLEQLTGRDHEVLNRAMELSRGGEYDFDESYELLFRWCQETMKTV